MASPNYAPGARVDTVYSVTDVNDLCDKVKTGLVAAGWTSTNINKFNILTFTGQPANNETIVIGGVTYTFKTAINNAVAREVLIGAALSNSLSNFAACVTGGAGSGTNYSSATVASTVVTCTASATELTITDLTHGTTAITLTETVANATPYWTGGNLSYRGYSLASGVAATGLRFTLEVYNTGWTDFPCAMVRWKSTLGTYSAALPQNPTGLSNNFNLGPRLGISAGLSWRVIANQYQFFIMADGASQSAQNAFAFGGMPFIPSWNAPTVITGASNATPIVITTNTTHGYSTGDTVSVRSVGGNTAANGDWTITVLSATTFSLNTSVGNGAYTSGGIVGKTNNAVGRQVAECIWMCDGGLIRKNLGSLEAGRGFHCLLNGTLFFAAGGSTNTGTPQILAEIPANIGFAATNEVLFYNNRNFGGAAWLVMGTSALGTGYVIGTLWDAIIYYKALSRDQIITSSVDGHLFRNLTDSNTGNGAAIGSATPTGSVYIATT